MFRENKELYKFDKFLLDVSERFLLKSGKRVTLTDRAFDTLCVLVRRGNRLVSKDELMTEVWADAIVEENNLDKNISTLRQILGERSGKQKFIETVRGHGYRFVAKVRRIENSESVEQSELPVPMSGLGLSEPPAVAGGLSQDESQESSVQSQSESQISNLESQNEYQNLKTKDQEAILLSAVSRPQSGNVVALNDWRREADEETSISDDLSEAVSKEQPAIIGTSPAAPTSSPLNGEKPTVSENIKPTLKPNRRNFAVALIGIGIIVALAGIGYAVYKLAVPPAMIFEPKKPTRITSTGKVKLAAISPDGKYVTYAQEENGEWQSLWTQHIASESGVQIAPPAAVQYRGLNVSPDGNQLYYVLGEGSLYQMPILGGATKKIADKLYTGPVSQVDIGISPDGKQIAFVRRFEKEASALFIINADGTNERTLAAFEQPIRLGSSVAWSLDGKIIACRELTNGFQNILAVRVADGTSATILPPDWVSVMQIAWVPDSKSLLINTLGGEIYQIFYPSGEAHNLALEPNYYNGLGLTSDGRFLAMVEAVQIAHIWTMSSNDASRARQLTAGFEKSDGVRQLNWTSDGKIVFDSFQNNKTLALAIDASGGNSKQIAKAEYSGTISPDGRFIVYPKRTATNDVNLWRMDVSDGREEQLTKGVATWVTFSPHGKWIVFTRFGERVGLWKVPLEGGEPTRILDENAICPAVSPDSKTVAFVWRQGGKPNRIALVSFDGGEIIKSFDVELETNPKSDKQNLQWTADGRGIYFIALNDGVSNIWRQPIDGGQPEQVTNFTTGRIFNFAYSPDGSQLALSRGTFDSDVVLIENAK